MDTKIASFTFFTFLFFTVSAARLAVDPTVVHGGEDEASSKLSATSRQSATAGSNILLPGQRPHNSEMDENNNNDRLPESEKTTNELTPQANFSRFHPINRHFHGKVPPRVQKPRRPCKHPMPPQHRNPRIERYNDDDDVASERMINLHPKASRGDFQSNWFKAQHHHNGPRRYHGGNNRNDVDEDVDVMMMNTNTKQVVDREKVKRSTIRQQKEKEKQKLKKKREEEAGLMRSIRKFLKHTFD